MTETLLRDRRKALDLTLRQVCEQVNAHGYRISPSSLSQYEIDARHASPDLILHLAEALAFDPLPVLASRGLIHPALTTALKHDAEAQRRCLETLGLVARM